MGKERRSEERANCHLRQLRMHRKTMTISDLTSKKPEELNRLLQKALGWHDLDAAYAPLVQKSHMLTPDKCSVSGIPDYCADHAAVAKVRAGLTTIQKREFAAVFAEDKQLVYGTKNPLDFAFALIDASPRYQTIALILTLHP